MIAHSSALGTAAMLLAAFILSAATPNPAMPSAESETPYFDMPFDSDYRAVMRERMIAQIERYLLDYTDRVVAERHRYWNRDLSSPDNYTKSVAPNRERLRALVGAGDSRVAPRIEVYAEATAGAGPLARTDAYTVFAVRWPVLGEITGEGLLLLPHGSPSAATVVFPDADQDPEELVGWSGDDSPVEPFAASLAEAGIAVIVPVVVSREMRWAEEPNMLIPVQDWRKENDKRVPTNSNLSNRETLWRQAYTMGRHLIGYELQRAYAALDWFQEEFGEAIPLGLAGYGEGGLLALYGAALDQRVQSALVSGYFGPREQLGSEPNERLIWGLLKEFGDAEIAGLVVPRGLVIEFSRGPQHEVVTPLPPPAGVDPSQLGWFQNMALKAAGAGVLTTPPFASVEAEVRRLNELFGGAAFDPPVTFVHGDGDAPLRAGSMSALEAFVGRLGQESGTLRAPRIPPRPDHPVDARRRQYRMVDSITEHLLAWTRRIDFERYRFFQGDYSSPAAWDRSMEPYRRILYEEILGKLPDAEDPPLPNPRQREVYDAPSWSAYEVVYDALPGVRGFGLLALPKDIPEGERRPLVVLQHGYLDTPAALTTEHMYNELMTRLCQRGFVVFAVQLTYKASMKYGLPVGATVFSFGVPQYEQALRWLKTLDYVDPDRIGYYGLSYGGRAGMYIPPLIRDFKFAVTSAHFSKFPETSLDPGLQGSALYHERFDTFKFNLGPRFGRAELALMIAPRGFMIENGYHDTAVTTEQAGYEYAKIQRAYDLLGIRDRVLWGAHIGRHEMHADNLFPYIHRMLAHPVPPVRRLEPTERIPTGSETR